MCAFYKGIEIPDNDAERVRALESYEILDSEPESDFDDITEIAASLTGCKVSYIGFFDDKRLWLKSKYGLPPDLTERPRELTLCSPTICQSDLVVVPDMSKDPRYSELPTVKNPPNARFYCAMPLINPEGFALGTLCVWDTEVMEIEPHIQQCIRRLAHQVSSKLELRRRIIETEQKISKAYEELNLEKVSSQNSKDIIRSLFPSSVARTIEEGGTINPQFFHSVTVMFVDFEGFTTLAETTEPRALIDQLGNFFSIFDRIIDKYGLEKIKTIGDGYLAASGLPEEVSDHAYRVCSAALEIRNLIGKRNAERRRLLLPEWPVRIGVHSGSVIGGVIDGTRSTYDIWGDGVNVAARLQENCEAGQINVSEATVGLLRDWFEIRPRGQIQAKNKGSVRMYYLCPDPVS